MEWDAVSVVEGDAVSVVELVLVEAGLWERVGVGPWGLVEAGLWELVVVGLWEPVGAGRSVVVWAAGAVETLEVGVPECHPPDHRRRRHRNGTCRGQDLCETHLGNGSRQRMLYNRHGWGTHRTDSDSTDRRRRRAGHMFGCWRRHGIRGRTHNRECLART